MPVQYKDYYESLGVPRTASADEIKKSFRKLAREHHPDVAKDKKKSEEKFKEINEAYEVLSDPDKRKKYDELGANWKSGAEFRPPPGYGGFGGGQHVSRRPADEQRRNLKRISAARASAISSSNCSARGCAARRGRLWPAGRFCGGRTGRARRDIEGDIMVTLEEAERGSVRTVTVRHASPHRNASGQNSGGRHRGPEAAHCRTRRTGRRRPAAICICACGSPSIPTLRWTEHNLDSRTRTRAVGSRARRGNFRADAGRPREHQNSRRHRKAARNFACADAACRKTGDLLVVDKNCRAGTKCPTREKKLWEQLARESKFNPRD